MFLHMHHIEDLNSLCFWTCNSSRGARFTSDLYVIQDASWIHGLVKNNAYQLLADAK